MTDRLLVISPNVLAGEPLQILENCLRFHESYAGKFRNIDIRPARGTLTDMVREHESDQVLLLGQQLAGLIPAPAGTGLNAVHMFGMLRQKRSGQRWIATPHPTAYSVDPTIPGVKKSPVVAANLMGHLLRHLELLKWGHIGWTNPTAPVRTRVVRDRATLNEFIEQVESARVVAIDTETRDLRRIGNQLLTVQMGVDGHTGWVLPVGHPGTPLDPRLLAIARSWLKRYLERGQPAVHVYANAAFDLHQFTDWLRLRWYNHSIYDVQYGAFGLDENRESRKSLGLTDDGDLWGLERICQEHGMFHYSHSPVRKDERHRLASLPFKNVAIYGALDAALPYRGMMMDLAIARARNRGMQDRPYTGFLRNATEIEGCKILQIVAMERNGLLVDKKYTASLAHPDSDFQREVRASEQEWKMLPEVVEANRRVIKKSNVGSGSIFGSMSGTLKREGDRWAFDLGKADHRQTLLFDVCGIQALTFGKNGQGSVDKAFKQANREVPIVRALADLEEARTMYGTFIVGYHEFMANSPDMRDGRLRCNFDGKATTSRLKCVAGWTPITTKRGVIPIIDVVVGDSVWTHMGRWRRVTEVISHGEYEVAQLTLSNGHELTCTPDHRLLRSNDTWIEAETLDGNCEQVGREPAERPRHTLALSGFEPSSDYGRNSQVVRYQSQKRAMDTEQPYAVGREEIALQTSVSQQQDRREEPHEGDDGRAPSWVEGQGDTRQEWLSHRRGEGRPPDASPMDHGSGARSGVVTLVSASPSHRREYSEQLYRQPGTMYESRSHVHSCALLHEEDRDTSKTIQEQTAREAAVSVRGIKRGLRTTIFDLTVDEDHSYEACGVFSHNSSKPNLQNQPTRKERGKMIKRQFVARRGRLYRKRDFSAHEVRMLGITAGDPQMGERFWVGMQTRLKFEYQMQIAKERAGWWKDQLKGADVHYQNYGILYNVDPISVTKDQRGGIKTTIFASTYGKSMRMLGETLKAEELTKLEDRRTIALAVANETSIDAVRKELREPVQELRDKQLGADWAREDMNKIDDLMREIEQKDWERHATQLYDLIFGTKFQVAGRWLQHIQREGQRTTHAKNILGGVRHLPGYLHPNRTIQRACNRRGPNCVDEETTCLTNDGWRRYDQLKIGDLIYTKNVHTGDLELQPIQNLTVSQYEGEMYKADNWSLDALVTPNHRWLADYRVKRGGVKVKRTGLIGTEQISSDKTGTSIHLHADRAIQRPGDGTWTDDEVELIGWIMTDGYYTTKQMPDGSRKQMRRIGVTQSERGNPHKVAKIDRLFDRMSLDVRRRVDGARGKIVWRFVDEWGDRLRRALPDKVITASFLNQLSTRQLWILYDTMLLGNGNQSRKTKEYGSFGAGTQQKAEAFSHLCVLLGLGHRVVSGMAKQSDWHYASMGNVPCPTQPFWTVRLKRRERAKIRQNGSWVQYKGVVWCPTVENGTFIARRNGTVYVTGNSAIQGPSSNIGLKAGWFLRKMVWQWFVSRNVPVDNVQCNAVHDSLESETDIVNIPLLNYLEHHAFSTCIHRFMRDDMHHAMNVGLESDAEVGACMSKLQAIPRWDDEVRAIREGIEWGNRELGWNLPTDRLMRAVEHNARIIHDLRRREIAHQLTGHHRTNYLMLMNQDNALKMGLIFEVDIGEEKGSTESEERHERAPARPKVGWRNELENA